MSFVDVVEAAPGAGEGVEGTSCATSGGGKATGAGGAAGVGAGACAGVEGAAADALDEAAGAARGFWVMHTMKPFSWMLYDSTVLSS